MHLSNWQLCSKLFSHEEVPVHEAYSLSLAPLQSISFKALTTQHVATLFPVGRGGLGWFGVGGRGGRNKINQNSPKTKDQHCICSPSGPSLQKLVLNPAGSGALESRSVPGVQVCCTSSWSVSELGLGKEKETW